MILYFLVKVISSFDSCQGARFKFLVFIWNVVSFVATTKKRQEEQKRRELEENNKKTQSVTAIDSVNDLMYEHLHKIEKDL